MRAEPHPVLEEEEKETIRRRECSLQDLLLRLARENLELRYDNGVAVSVSLADADDGSVELRAGGQSWQWTNGSSKSEAEACRRTPNGLHDTHTVREAMEEDESESDGGKLQYGGKYGPKLQSAWDQMQSTSGRGRRGEEARKDARRLKEVTRQVVLANKSKCVLCGQPPPIPNDAVTTPAVSTGRSGLPRFG